LAEQAGARSLPPPMTRHDPTAQPEPLVEVEVALVGDRLEGSVLYSGQHLRPAGIQRFTELISQELSALLHPGKV
ncbi:MAG: hypothetical protein QOE58_1677, partial [Actinomycetota bacterium]|nr:hypothetical protein [Actinomycetota bacterium]